MNKFFYLRLAWTNMGKNKTIYAPYLMAGTLSVMLFYILSSITFMVEATGEFNSRIVLDLMKTSVPICGIVAMIMLFYINSFVIKQRKKEFGLYSILGMKKQNIAWVILWEVLITGGICILLGILCGALLSQLIFLLFMKIVHLKTTLSFQIPFDSVGETLILFGIGFVLVLVYDLFCIWRTNAIGLLHSEKQGEKEPKTQRLMAVVGVLSLAAGYTLAINLKNQVLTLSLFFLMVFLVTVGTYFLFISGSVIILKQLRKNKNFYYKKRNFTAVSGMLYRMKQNAVGLGTICILSTAVLLTLSFCICLLTAEEEALNHEFPRQISATFIENEEGAAVIKKAAADQAAQHGFEVLNPLEYNVFLFYTNQYGDNRFVMDREEGVWEEPKYKTDVITLEDYNRNAGVNETLEQGEVLMYLSDQTLKTETLILQNQTYNLKKTIEPPAFMGKISAALSENILVVIPDKADLEALKQNANQGKEEGTGVMIWHYYRYDVAGDLKQLPELYKNMYDELSEEIPRFSGVENIDETRAFLFLYNGTILFVGVLFLFFLFMGTVFNIY
ncbi:MAG: ABC transporter permease [Eubacterium sp.]